MEKVMLSAKEHAKKEIVVKGKTMSYVEMGEGDPIIFQHGNPLHPIYGGMSCRIYKIRGGV